MTDADQQREQQRRNAIRGAVPQIVSVGTISLDQARRTGPVAGTAAKPDLWAGGSAHDRGREFARLVEGQPVDHVRNARRLRVSWRR